ncbi:hypothetical protein [Planktothrix sp. FACHB-1355]|nr:hypothetical protein [Planktothrix sp. FACHB-1355]
MVKKDQEDFNLSGVRWGYPTPNHLPVYREGERWCAIALIYRS